MQQYQSGASILAKSIIEQLQELYARERHSPSQIEVMSFVKKEALTLAVKQFQVVQMNR